MEIDSKIDLRHVQISTGNILLRPWILKNDLDDYFAMASNPQVANAAGFKAHDCLEQAKSYLRKTQTQKENLAIYHKSDNRVVGYIGACNFKIVKNSNNHWVNSFEIYYALHPSYWGQGIAVMAAKSFINFAFDNLDINIITCSHFAKNAQSKRVIEKCGFSYSHKKLIYAPQLNKHFESLCYILNKADNPTP